MDAQTISLKFLHYHILIEIHRFHGDGNQIPSLILNLFPNFHNLNN